MPLYITHRAKWWGITPAKWLFGNIVVTDGSHLVFIVFITALITQCLLKGNLTSASLWRLLPQAFQMGRNLAETWQKLEQTQQMLAMCCQATAGFCAVIRWQLYWPGMPSGRLLQWHWGQRGTFFYRLWCVVKRDLFSTMQFTGGSSTAKKVTLACEYWKYFIFINKQTWEKSSPITT